MSSFADLLNSPLKWEIELSTRCNSRCVGCSRYSELFYDNPFFDPRMDLDVNVLKQALHSSLKIDFILLCGVYGDPLLHPQLFPILDHIRETYGEIHLSVHTNGSFGNKEFWKKLGSYFRNEPSAVKFAFDGMADSHELFRRGTKWEHVRRNAEAFIEGGGRAVWKMIEFAHNHNDIEAARKMHADMGFVKFELRQNNFEGIDSEMAKKVDIKCPPKSVRGTELPQQDLLEWNKIEAQRYSIEAVECRSLSNKNIYLDAHGRLWPCCWVGGLRHRPEHELRQWFEKLVLAGYAPDFNSLHTHELKEVLAHPWFQKDLPASWDVKTAMPQGLTYSTCAQTCGVKCKGT